MQVLDYQMGTGWIQTNPLPGPRSGGKAVNLAGATSVFWALFTFNDFEGVVHLVGGAVGFSRLSTILAWDPVSGVNTSEDFHGKKVLTLIILETWAEVGNLGVGR